MSDKPSGQSHLVRQIGLWSGVAVVVGSTIGSGIFKSPAGIATKVPDPIWMLAVWVLGGLFTLCGALTIAEVGSAFPFSGGVYVFVREGYGRLAGFMFGWAQLVLLRPASVGAVSLAFAQYALRLTGRTSASPDFVPLSAALAIGALIAVVTANVLGVRFGTGIQNVTTIAKSLGLLTLVVLALVIGLPHAAGHFTSSPTPVPWSMMGLALVSVLWAYDGWVDGAYIAGEMKDPKRNVPRAILFGTLFIVTIYLLANVGYLSVFSVGEIAKSPTIAADTMWQLVGAGGVVFIVATVMISTFGTLNGTVLTSPRIFYALAEDRLFFKQLAYVHPRFKTPYVAVILVGFLGVSYVIAASALAGDKAFGALSDAFVISILPFYALAVGSVFLFRRRAAKAALATPVAVESDSLVDVPGSGISHGHLYAPSVRTPLFPMTPVVFVLSVIYLLVNSLVQADSRVPTLITLGVLVVGIPVYYSTVGRKAPK